MSRRSVDVQHHRDLPTVPGEHPCDSKIRATVHLSFPARATQDEVWAELWAAFKRTEDELADWYQEANAA